MAGELASMDGEGTAAAGDGWPMDPVMAVKPTSLPTGNAEDWQAQYLPTGTYFGKTLDAVLLVKGVRLPAHKIVLAMHSGLFHSAFEDTNADASKGPTVLESCFAQEEVKDIVLLLQYMYSRDVQSLLTKLAIRQLMVLTRFAKQFIVKHLEVECNKLLQSKFESMLQSRTMDGNLVECLLMADAYSMEWHLVWCERLAIQFLPTVLLDSRVEQLSVPSWRRISAGVTHVALKLQRATNECSRCYHSRRVDSHSHKKLEPPDLDILQELHHDSCAFEKLLG